MASPTSTLKLIRHPTHYEIWQGDKLSFSKELNSPSPNASDPVFINDMLYRLEIICQRHKLFMVQTQEMFDVYRLTAGGAIHFIKRYEDDTQFFGYFSNLGILATRKRFANTPDELVTFYHVFSGELAYSIRMIRPRFMKDYILAFCEFGKRAGEYMIFRLYYQDGMLQHDYELKAGTELFDCIYGNTKDYILTMEQDDNKYNDNSKHIGDQKSTDYTVAARFVDPLTQTVVEEILLHNPGFYQAMSYNFDGNGIVITTKAKNVEAHHAVSFTTVGDQVKVNIEKYTQKQVYTNSQITLLEDDETRRLKDILSLVCGSPSELIEIILDYS